MSYPGYYNPQPNPNAGQVQPYGTPGAPEYIPPGEPQADPNDPTAQQIQDVLGQGGTSFTGGNYDLAAQVSALYEQIGASHVVGGSSSTLNADAILQGWDSQGIDSGNKAVISAAEIAAQLPTDQQAQFLTEVGATFATDSKFQKPTGTYYQALDNYGLGDESFQQQQTQGADSTSGATKEDVLGHGPKPHFTREQTMKYVNGVFYYANGVIADPSNGAVFYDPKNKAPGSPVWITNAQKWSEQKTANWRAELFQMGYVDTKKGGWDQPLIDATRTYYNAKYLNGNRAVAAGQPGGGSAATSTPPFDLHQLHASIQSQVQQQYQSVFGEDPSADELRSWTRFIINTGMSLQKGGARTSLSPSAALSEAEARAARQVTNSPEGSAMLDHQRENTTLHDSLVSAIAATNGLA